MKELDLRMPSKSVRVGVAAAQFNRFITDQLLEGAMDAFRRNGLNEDQLVLAWVPGAFELPLAARRLLDSGCDAVLALGAVIRGGTPHFDYVAGECARGLSRLALERGQPVVFGVLTTDDIEQAVERAAIAEGNKGFDVAMATMQMLGMLEQLEADKGGG